MSTWCQDYRMTRRTMIGATAASLLGLRVRQSLGCVDAGKNRKPKAEHVILFFNSGGMSHLDTWDPKLGRRARGEFQPIDTSAPGVQISEIFPQLSKQMHHCALIRSVVGTEDVHTRAVYNLLTSYLPNGSFLHPGIGSLVVLERDRLGDLPAYISISGRAPRAGYLPRRCEAQFVASPGDLDPCLWLPEGITRAHTFDDAAGPIHGSALQAFELTKVPRRTLNRYGETSFGRGALLAKRLVNLGVRFVQVNRGGFDTHRNNFQVMRTHAEVMDRALAALVADLAASGMLQKTLVVMMSEFGRSPRINHNAGRDHWAACFSVFMAGGGINGGTVVGASDNDGYQPARRPVLVSDLHASICRALGIDHNKEVLTPCERRIKLVNRGNPISELFS